MKRLATALFLMSASLLLPGCWFYMEPAANGCDDDCGWCDSCDDCDKCGRNCWDNDCNGGYGAGYPWKHCETQADCGVNETCGADNRCHTGDCMFWGCPDGQTCALSAFGYQCVLSGCAGAGGSGGAGSSSGNGGDAGAGGACGGGAGAGGTGGSTGPDRCANPTDCPAGQFCSDQGVCTDGTCTGNQCVTGYDCVDGACVSPDPAACVVHEHCQHLGADYKCINGKCTPPADQCTDKTQCPNPDSQRCVEGKCVAACNSADDCPTGFTCDPSLRVCVNPTQPCTKTADCDGDKVCVAGACVEGCDSSGKCRDGYVCVANGCVPDEEPKFTCNKEGEQDACSSGSICLHHSCYITCTPDPNSCRGNTADLNQCKSVESPSGEFNVCGSSNNLGNQCASSKPCSGGKVCIDGYCR